MSLRIAMFYQRYGALTVQNYCRTVQCTPRRVGVRVVDHFHIFATHCKINFDICNTIVYSILV